MTKFTMWKKSEVKKMTKLKRKKVIKIKIKSYPTHVHFCRPGRKHVQSFKNTGLNCMRSCNDMVPTVYTSEVSK